MTLQDAIKIGLDNSEVIRVIPLGAQGIPVGGFEPQFLAVGNINTLGAGNLSTVYDPAIQETQIQTALSQFDANFATNILWSHNALPFNNSIGAGFFAVGNRFPLIQFQDAAQFAASIQKRTMTGALLGITHNVNYQFTNSPVNVYPSAYTTNLQLTFTQPLLGSAPTPNFNPNPNPAGIEANRAPIVIARLRTDYTVWQFKAQVMNMVRSIEQQYWALASAQVQYWASETAVDLGEQILRREKAKLQVGSSSIPNVAEAEEQLERFRLDFVNNTANLITVERQLRNLLGLPPADNRRIVPVTAPTEALLIPSWEASLSQMINYQPDIVQGQLLVRVAELQLLVARNQLLPVLNFNMLYQFNGLGHHLDQAEAVMTGKSIQAIDPILQAQQRAAGLNPIPGTYNNFQSYQFGLTFQMPIGYRGPLANTRFSQYTLLQQRAYLQQLVHQTSHQLARFFLEVDTNYKLFKTASRLKAAALQRLEAQKAFYENGTITIDRYLDAVNRWASAVAQEADFKNRYNTAIAALEETKGTLLAYDNIALAEGPWPEKAYIQARDQQEGHRQHPTGGTGDYHPHPVSGPPVADPVPPVTPPTYTPESVPPQPPPSGLFGPGPFPVPAAVPAGQPPVLMNRQPTEPQDAQVQPVSGSQAEPSGPREVPLELPTSPGLPALPGAGGTEDAPESLPPLPQ